MIPTYDALAAMNFWKNKNMIIKNNYYRYLHNFLECGVKI